VRSSSSLLGRGIGSPGKEGRFVMRSSLCGIARGMFIAAAGLAFIAAGAPHSRAESPRSLVKDGNRRLERGEYERALEYYDRASVDEPESAVLSLNMGNAHFLMEEYGAARTYFEEAALRSDDLILEAMAWYNIGNTAFRQAQRQEDSDLQKALEHYQEGVSFYQTALEKDPELGDAAYNLEITRLTIKNLLDRINKQREAMERQREKLQEIVDSLQALVRREERSAGESRNLDAETGRGKAWERRLSEASGSQEGIRSDTEGVRRKLQDLFPEDQRPLPAQKALSHIDSSMADQSEALDGLRRRDPGAAAPDQDAARGQLEKALEALTEGQQPPEQQGQQQEQQKAGDQEPQPEERPEPSQEQQARQARDETARDIIDKERENKKRRQQEAMRGYKKVDKDW
jgi:tetratricopeptide (TPR) repeat protein